MGLSYSDIVGALEQEFFLARIRNQIDCIDNPEELRVIILSLVDLLQRQRETFVSLMQPDAEED